VALLVLVAGVVWWHSVRRAGEETAVSAALEPAERSLREAVLKAPRDIEARRAVGQYLVARRRPYEAMWSYQDALELSPDDPESRRGLARALIMAQLPRRGLEVLATGAPTSSQNQSGGFPPQASAPEIQNPKSKNQNDEVEDRRVAAAAYLTLGDPMGAVTMLEAVGPALDSSPPALLDLGNAFEALGDDLSAARAYQQLTQLQPDNVEGELSLARVAARHRSWAVVFAALSRAQTAAPGDPRPMYQLSRALQAGGRAGSSPGLTPRQDPMDLYRRLLQSHPDFGPAHLQIGLWYLHHGQPGAAIPSLERAVAAGTGGEETRLRLAEALEASGQKAEAAFHRGRYDETIQEPLRAIREYQRLAALDPARKDVPLLLTAVYNQIDQNEQAARVARQGFEREPEDLSLRARYAMLLIMTDSRSQAAQLCQRWMKDRPNWGEPYFLLGRMEREALHPAEAVKLLDQALTRDPRNAGYCLESASALMAERTPAGLRAAAGRLRQALAIEPSNAEAHQLLGETLERLGDLQAAAREYLRSMDHARSVRFGVYSLSRLCPRLQKMDRARFYAENVRVLREREDGVQALWRQVHRSPQDAAAHAQLADLLLQAGDTQQALYQLQQAVRLRPDRAKERQLQILRRLQTMREG
jgi:tetratricopeptide (TPR) repeat protein